MKRSASVLDLIWERYTLVLMGSEAGRPPGMQGPTPIIRAWPGCFCPSARLNESAQLPLEPDDISPSNEETRWLQIAPRSAIGAEAAAQEASSWMADCRQLRYRV